jgi:hypothetical protein
MIIKQQKQNHYMNLQMDPQAAQQTMRVIPTDCKMSIKPYSH